jgi:hypothetical protein
MYPRPLGNGTNVEILRPDDFSDSLSDLCPEAHSLQVLDPFSISFHHRAIYSRK